MRMIAVANPDRKDDCWELGSEVHQLALIFSSILRQVKAE
jgi:hypothetical protein